MKKFISYLFPIFIPLFFISCQKEVEVKLPKSEDKIVVEGYIENGSSPFVLLTRNNTSGTGSLKAKPIINALIVVSDGQTIDTLKEINFSGFEGIYFDLTNKIIGETEKSYALTVISEGKMVTAETTIPDPVVLDSIWWQEEVNYPDYGYGHAKLSDPGAVANNYKLYTKALHKDDDFISPLGDTFDDKFFNGKEFSVFFGHSQNALAIQDGMFARGDTFVTKFCSLDKDTYEFWRTLELEKNTNGNPFASPVSIKSNIKGGLGIWGGYGIFLDTAVAQ